MCGIVAGFSKKGKPLGKSVMKRYEAQEQRGSQGFGYTAYYKDGIGGKVSVGRSTDEKGIREAIMKEHSSMINFHHRYPTSTPNLLEATHPIYVSHDELDYDYFVVHNGVIRNSDELRKKHEELGYIYNTIIEVETMTHFTSKRNGNKSYQSLSKIEKFNDSESLAIEVARCLDGMTRTIDTVGTCAMVAWQINKETGKLKSISYGHNAGNPLTITDNKDHFFLTSIGGTNLPEDILYTLSTDGDSIGTTAQQELSISYNSDWYRTNKSNSYKYVSSYFPKKEEDPNCPFPAIGMKQDIRPKNKEWIKNKNGTYESYNDYFIERYGYIPQRSIEWQEEGDKLTKTVKKEKCGFDTDQNFDTTNDFENTAHFMARSEQLVREYLDLEDSKISIMADIDTAEYLLRGNNDKNSVAILKKDIYDNETILNDIQEKMNGVEDTYCDEFPDHVSFKTLVEAYVDQEKDDFDGIQEAEETRELATIEA